MTDLDKAREWAKSVGKIEDLMSEPRAAVEVIQSLPDQWVDAEEVREILFHMVEDSLFEESLHPHVNALECLLPPKPPTLADMTEEERKACQWMQADVKLSGKGSVTCVIADPGNPGAKVRLWAPHGGSDDIEAGRVTPLPDLPKLQWPGSEPVEPHALPEGMRLADHEEYGRVVVSPKVDTDGDYKVFCSQDHTEYGYAWWYTHKSELTFLDGDQHV